MSLDLDRFGSHIVGSDPIVVSTAAQAFVSAKRAELGALRARTYDNTVAAAVANARSDLNLACGLLHEGAASA